VPDEVDWLFPTYEVYANTAYKRIMLRGPMLCDKMTDIPAFELNKKTTAKIEF